MDITKQTDVLYTDISQLIDTSKQKLAIAINSELPMLYWNGKNAFRLTLLTIT